MKPIKAALLFLFVAAVAAQATPVLVSLPTGTLPAGTYYLDFQLAGTDNTLGTNTVSITNLSFGSGAFQNAALSNASGSYPNYTLTDADYFNEALIGFTRGSSVSFQLSFTNYFSGNGTPDTFTMALLDEAYNSIVSIGLGASLSVNLDTSFQPVIQTFAADGTFGSMQPVVSTLDGSAAPEPGALMLLATGVGALVLAHRRRQV